MPDLDTSQWIAVIGWPVTFLLGMLATLTAQKFSRSRKRISWTVVNESNLLSRKALKDLSSGFGVPIQVLVNDVPRAALSTIRIKLLNTGNSDIEGITMHFRFGDKASVHVGRYVGKLGAYLNALHLEKSEKSARLVIDHMNKKQAIELEFLVGSYDPRSIEVDLAEPGIELRVTDIEAIDSPLNPNLLRFLRDFARTFER